MGVGAPSSTSRSATAARPTSDRTGTGSRTTKARATKTRTSARTAKGTRRAGPGGRWLERLESPLAAYYLILGSGVALTVIGLVMVLSSSSVESLAQTNMQSSYSFFTKQAVFAALGVPLAWVAARLPARTWQRLSWPMLIGAVGLLGLVPLIGHRVNGNQNWIAVGGVSMQPSELAKLALLVWAATVLVAKQDLLHLVPHMLVPVLPVASFVLLLVLVGGDLGTSLVLIAIVFGVLFIAGAPLRVFAASAALAVLCVALLVVTSPNRMSRVTDWLSGGGGADYLGMGWQSAHGSFALATGGWWGVGLGASKEKWFWLPEAHNDFIFAIIGEELGLPGTLAVLALFAMLGFGLLRLVLTTDDLFVQLVTGGVLLWVIGQAVVNIGAVLGMLPVVGVPLPLVSSGGSALVMTMVALGMVLGFARRVPGAQEALTARTGVVRRCFAVLPQRAAWVARRPVSRS